LLDQPVPVVYDKQPAIEVLQADFTNHAAAGPPDIGLCLRAARRELPLPRQITDEQKAIMKDAAVFAAKLWLDGIKDFVLAVAGLAAAGFDLLRGRSEQGYLFHRVMRVGKRVDAALDVYGEFKLAEALRHLDPSQPPPDPESEAQPPPGPQAPA
jgi:hypothetical protein